MEFGTTANMHIITLLYRSFMPVISLLEKSMLLQSVGSSTNKREVYSHGEENTCPMQALTSLEFRQKLITSLWQHGTGRLLMWRQKLDSHSWVCKYF